VEEAVRGYFKALDAGNFAKAYSYLDLSPTAARSFGFQSQQEFVNYWHLTGMTGIVINSLKVKKLLSTRLLSPYPLRDNLATPPNM
jgi:hypothetical protein